MYFVVMTLGVSLVILVAASPQLVRRRDGTAIPLVQGSSWLNDDGSIDFDAFNYHVEEVRAKYIRRIDNYTGPSDSTAPEQNWSRKRDGGTGIPIKTFRKKLWYGEISVGTPPKSFNVHLDTGAGDFFLPASTCDASCDGHTRWDPSESETKQNLNKLFQIEFGDGAGVSGELYTDNVTIAGLTATAQTIGAATKYSSRFRKSIFPPDGAMGMAFGALSSSHHDTFFETLVNENKVTESVFSFKLNSTGGELYIGGSNDELHTGNFAYAKVTERLYWKVTMQRVFGNGRQIIKDVSAVIDTGASLIGGPSPQVNALHKKLGGRAYPYRSGYYTYPCKSLPKVSLAFGGRLFPISISTMNRGRVSLSDCLCGIIEVNTDGGFWVIGDVFLQNVYTAFDVGGSRVGFAKLV